MRKPLVYLFLVVTCFGGIVKLRWIHFTGEMASQVLAQVLETISYSLISMIALRSALDLLETLRENRAGATEPRLLELLQSLLPDRVAREDYGDLLERIAQWNGVEWRWRRRRAIAWGMFWVLVNGTREHAAVFMKRLFKLWR